jgi:GR25 family glycosyltransferase involved in LPS biosynthesis
MEQINIYVINLKRREDRLHSFYERINFPKEKINIITAFDGKNYQDEPEELKQLYNRLSPRLNPGEKGCFISHMMAYKDIIKNNYNFSLIFEDDCYFCEDFNNKINMIINEMPKDTQILYIGGRGTPNFKMEPSTCTKITENIVSHKLTNWNMRDKINHDRCAYSYIISKELASKFLNYCKNNYNFNSLLLPIDHWMIKTCLDNKISIYNSYPLLCFSDPNSKDSDIRNNSSLFFAHRI